MMNITSRKDNATIKENGWKEDHMASELLLTLMESCLEVALSKEMLIVTIASLFIQMDPLIVAMFEIIRLTGMEDFTTLLKE